jgi:hypothetical protein
MMERIKGEAEFITLYASHFTLYDLKEKRNGRYI